MRIVGVIAGLASALLGVWPAAANIVPDPGFEDDPSAWVQPAVPGAEFALDATVAHSGARSARVTGTDTETPSRFARAWRLDVPAGDPGELFFSVWVKARDLRAGSLNVLYRDAHGEVLKNAGIASFAGTFDWKQYGAPLEAVAGTASLQLVLGLRQSGGTVWFDDIFVGPRAALAGSGRVSFGPDEPRVAGETAPWAVVYTVGASGLPPGGRLDLQWDNWRTAREYRLRNLRLSTVPRGIPLTVTRPPRNRFWPPEPRPVDVVLEYTGTDPLPEGTEIRCDADLTVSPATNVRAAVRLRVQPGPGAIPLPVGDACRLDPQSGPASRLVCVAEARPPAGETGRVTVAVTDSHGNPATGFAGEATLDSVPGGPTLPPYRYTAADAGSHVFEVLFPTGTVSRITARSGDMKAVSNPVLPRDPDEPGVYFGDIHAHSELSADGVGDPDEAYRYAGRVAGLDFAGLSDHSPRGERWQAALAAAERNDRPGRFVTMVGYEWSHTEVGHRNVYYPDGSGPEQPDLPTNMGPLRDYLDERGIEALVVPHHPNTRSVAKRPDGTSVWGPTDWSLVDMRYQRLVEICQNRGSFEVPGPNPELRVVREDCGASVQAALAAGHRLGFIGSTDTHSGRPGQGSARAAILAPELTRRSLWDALHARACYATTGPHVLVFFSVNGHPMGSEIETDADEPRTIRWRVVGTGGFRRVDLLRNNLVVESRDAAGEEDFDGVLRYGEPLRETEWWYLRAIREDTHLAWSGPVWVTGPTP